MRVLYGLASIYTVAWEVKLHSCNPDQSFHRSRLSRLAVAAQAVRQPPAAFGCTDSTVLALWSLHECMLVDLCTV